jgi:DNA-binding NarL/FixJ family response regulator
MPTAITLFLADDETMVRQGLRALLETRADFSVIGEAANGREAVRLVQRVRPDVAILDSLLPELNGIDAALEIHEKVPATAGVLLSSYYTSEHVHLAVQAGVRGYVTRRAGVEELIQAVRTVHAGSHYLDKTITDLPINEYLRLNQAESPLESLSSRERQILQLVVEGKKSAEIGTEVHISRKTVETYRSRLMEKLGIHGLPGLVKFAIRHGLTSVE